MTKKYCVAQNYGKGFITHEESSKIEFSGLPGNLWSASAEDTIVNTWISKISGIIKTLSEAQAIVDAEIVKAQSTYDADTEKLKKQEPYISLTIEQKAQQDTLRSQQRPKNIVLN
jgi:nitrogenase subunit NifH